MANSTALEAQSGYSCSSSGGSYCSWTYTTAAAGRGCKEGFLALTVSSSSLFTPALLRTHSFVFFAVHETINLAVWTFAPWTYAPGCCCYDVGCGNGV